MHDSSVPHRRFEIVPYDETWPSRFATERDLLVQIFQPILCSIHHIGSTAVPGLPAKPVIDILVVVRDDGKLGDYDAAMINIGYRPRGDAGGPFTTPGRFYYSKDTGGYRSHQVHVCKIGHPDIADKLAFMRYLTEHPQVAREYADVKNKGAEDHRHDIVGYIAAKERFVKRITRRAFERYPDIV